MDLKIPRRWHGVRCQWCTYSYLQDIGRISRSDLGEATTYSGEMVANDSEGETLLYMG